MAGSRNAVLVPVAPGGLTNACYVEAEPGSRSAVEEMLPAWFPPSQSWIVTPLVAPANFGNDVVESVRFSPLYVALALGGTLLLVSSVVWWSRRQEFALYRLLGFSTASLLGMLFLEWLTLVLTPAIAGLMIAIFVLPARSVDSMFVPAGGVIVAAFVVMLFTGPPLGLVILRSSRLSDVLKGV